MNRDDLYRANNFGRAVDRFWRNVQRRGDGECWPWLGGIKDKGHGYMSVAGKTVGAHRVSVILSGREIPEGLVVDHMCRNPACVNPAHLRVVTTKVNALENSSSVGAVNANRTHCSSGHPLSGENLYLNPKGHRCCRACGLADRLAYQDRILSYERRQSTRRAKLSPEEVRVIRERCANGDKLHIIAADYGVDLTLISQIKRRKIWRHI